MLMHVMPSGKESLFEVTVGNPRNTRGAGSRSPGDISCVRPATSTLSHVSSPSLSMR